jgi:pimeloyl-ACP methyl ester carboxylesterase
MPFVTARDGTRLFYTEAGQGRPVLCLAGLTRNGGDFDHVAPHLADCRLIRLDARGRGQSDHADPATYTVPTEVGDVLTLLDHLALDRVAVLGTSRGGLVAMAMAAMAPGRLTGVALNDIGPVIDRPGLEIIKGYLGRNPAQKTWEDAALARARLWTGFRDVPHERWLHEVGNQYDQTDQGLVIRYDPRLRAPFLAAMEAQAPDLWPLFDRLTGLPLCIIRGQGSDLFSAKTLAEMVRRRPDAVVATVPGRGHVPFLDEPLAVAAIRQWVGMLP